MMRPTASRLTSYLDRIGFRGVARPDLPTLRELHWTHVRTVPFENLDVQLHRTVGLDLDAMYDKVVRRHRGGWCFELNGLLGWALGEIGFDVTRIGAGVMRERFGDERMGNHLCLMVHVDEPHLVDVGFGGSLSRPVPLAVAVHQQSPYEIRLTDLGAGFWRFSELARAEPFSFDLFKGAADETRFARHCTLLQREPSSPFVQNLVVQRRMDHVHLALRGRVLTTLREAGEEKVVLQSAQELVATLRQRFELDVPEAASLWPAICERHGLLFERSPDQPRA